MTRATRAHSGGAYSRGVDAEPPENRPDLKAEQLQRTRRLMDAAVPEALVAGYERHVQDLSLPDSGDRHVLAAAIESEAEVIVTFNERDFPSEALRPFGVRAADPDAFVLELMDAFEEEVVGAARRHRAALVAPTKSVEEYLATFRRQRLVRTAGRLADFAGEL